MSNNKSDFGGGHKYSARNLTFSQIVAIVESDYKNRGRAIDMADGWRQLAILANRVQSHLDSARTTLADSFATEHSMVFFEHVDDVIASAESAVSPAEMNAESLDGAVAEVERLKPVIEELVAEDALYTEHRHEMSVGVSGTTTEYDAAKADVLAEAQDEFQISDEQFAGHRFAMFAPDTFTGPEWHGPDRISEIGDYRNVYYPGGQPAAGAGVYASGGSGDPLSSSASSTPTSSGPQLQSSAPPVATPTPGTVPSAPAAPGPGAPQVPSTGFAPVTGNPPGRGMVPSRAIPPSANTRPTPGMPPRPSTTPGQSPLSQRGAPSASSGTRPGTGPQPPRGSTPGGRPPTSTSVRQNAPGSDGRTTPRSGSAPGSPPKGTTPGRAPTIGKAPADGRTPPNSKTQPTGKTPSAGKTPPNGKAPAAPRGVVKPNIGFEQSVNRNLPRTTPSVVGGREGNSPGGKPAGRPTTGGRVIGARRPAAPKLQPGSLTRDGVVSNNRKPTTPTWARTQPMRTASVPRSGVIGRREYFAADKPPKSSGRQERQSRRNARIAKLTGKSVATPPQHELMDGVMDRTVPGVIGKRPNVS